MMKLIFACFWYLLPAALGNHNASCGDKLPLPGFIKRPLEKLARPVDGGAVFRGKALFGKNKTWRGLAVGIVTGILVAAVQAVLYLNTEFFRNNTLIDYGRNSFILVGALMGSGALLGDLAESFVKRRFEKPSGRPWFPWDQIDWIIGAMVLSLPVYAPDVKIAGVTLVLYTAVHLCSDRIVYMLGIKTREEVN